MCPIGRCCWVEVLGFAKDQLRESVMRLGSRERRPKKLQRKRISGANKCRISILESACIILWFLYLGISRHDETCCLSSKDDLRCYRRRVASIRPPYKQTIMKIMPKVQSDSPLGSPTHQRHSSYIRPAIKSSVRGYLLEIYHNYRHLLVHTTSNF